MHSWQIIVSQFTSTMAPRRDSSTVTRPTSGVISQAGDPSKIEEDKNEVQDYVKEALFEKVVFVWNKGALQTDGVLHKDYLTNCRWQADECYRQRGRNIHELTVDNDGKGKLLSRMA
jgi:hypothetical protein